MKPHIVVIRLHSGDDILTILEEESVDYVIIERPHFAKYDVKNGSMSMMPYCPLSDDIYYRLDRNKIEFIVEASPSIASAFLKMVDEVSSKLTQDILDDDSYYDQVEAFIRKKSFIDGNGTKH